MSWDGRDGIDPEKEKVNNHQLIDAAVQTGSNEMMNKQFASIESINKKLEKLDIVEKEVKDLRDNVLKKADVEKIIQEQLMDVKTTLVGHDLKIKKTQAEMRNMDKRLLK